MNPQGSPGFSRDRLYIIFVHYGLRKGTGPQRNPDEEDWWLDGAPNPINTERITSRLSQHVPYLNDLIQPRLGWRGQAFIFLDIGWAALLRGDRPALLFGLAVQLSNLLESLRNKFRKRGIKAVQLITSADLSSFVDSLGALSGKLHQFLAGGQSGLLYDAPKVVEAVLRIANLGRGVPVFRFDDDVIFVGAGRPFRESRARMLRTCYSILELCHHYEKLANESSVSYFIFSGHYGGPSPKDKAEYKDFWQSGDAHNPGEPVLSALNDYATRLVELAQWPVSGQQAAFNVDKLRQFLENLEKIGANPFRQVISGAGLCLGDSAILDLPPFSNMTQNVMWIDDHLKYALHHELRHFGYYRGTPQVARVANAVFLQSRHETMPEPKDVAWHLRVYLQRFILGCVADTWLRGDVGLKGPLAGLPDAEFQRLMKLLPSDYARTLANMITEIDSFLSAGAPNQKVKQQKAQLKERLWMQARQRLGEVMEKLSAVAPGTALQEFLDPGSGVAPQYLPEKWEGGLVNAMAEFPDTYASAEKKLKSNSLKGSTATLAVWIKILVDDFVDYIEWVCCWKYFVYAVRNLLNWTGPGTPPAWLDPFKSE